MATIPRPGTFRQSILAGWETCPRRTMHDLLSPDDSLRGWVDTSGLLGTAFHAFAAEYLRTLHKYGHARLGDPDDEHGGGTEEAMAIMREVYDGLPFTLNTQDRHTLRMLVLKFTRIPFPPSRIALADNGHPAIERRLTLDVECKDGVTRTLKGQPDLILLDPPNGLIIRDWKTGQGRPKDPRDRDKVIVSEKTGNELVVGRKYLSDRGHFQLDVYGLLALKGRLDDGTMLSPLARRVTLQEYHLRSGQVRQATLEWDDLEHVEHDVEAHLRRLDDAIGEGDGSELWAPRPGSHCLRQCPVARSCPVPLEQRGVGAFESQDDADAAAAMVARWEAVRDQELSRLKEWNLAGNPPGQPNAREAYRWGPEPDAWKEKGGGRSFKIWPAVNGNGNGGQDGA